mmetsp:Transcript_91222/g.294867  ORF Transcript_91222/g.294867 Transcript_91222/m.294867 type:complete len:480 (-) Transcript_91222:428-1867(-)
MGACMQSGITKVIGRGSSWSRPPQEKKAVTSTGDVIFLRAWIGNSITVEETSVHAHWDHQGEWQKLTIEKLETVRREILNGDIIFLKAWTGAVIDADAPDSAGVVQARWNHQGDWQTLVVEFADAPADAPKATTAAPTATEDAPTTTVAAPTTTVAVRATCVQKKSLGKCQPCLKTEQCEDGRYCCPFMKKCVASSSEGCYAPIAGCRPVCYDSQDNEQCQCSNTDFPHNWQLPICSSPTPASAPTPAPALTTTGSSRSSSTSSSSSSSNSSSSSTETTSTFAASTTETVQQALSAKVSDKEWEHFQLLNKLRATGFTCPAGSQYAPNLVALKLNCKLWRAAQLHSQDMADNEYFSHSSKDGRSPWDRAAAQGTSANGENIAAGDGLAQGVLEHWKNSDSHCKNMMSPGFKAIGVGHGQGVGVCRHYWTLIFTNSDVVDDTSCYPAASLLSMGRVGAHAPAEADKDVELAVGEPWRSIA